MVVDRAVVDSHYFELGVPIDLLRCPETDLLVRNSRSYYLTDSQFLEPDLVVRNSIGSVQMHWHLIT